MEYYGEFKAFVIVLLFAISSMCYCCLIPMRITSGVKRLLSVLPVIAVFFILPLLLSTIHLTFSAFYYLTWLANFKLVLFAFNRGPLASTPPLRYLIFISIALLPINLKRFVNKMPYPHLDQSGIYIAQIVPSVSHETNVSTPSHRPILLAFKAMILVIIVNAYNCKYSLHHNVIVALYFCHTYLALELCLALSALSVKIYLGFEFEMEPQFNEPCLATSLQDFWGRGWNLVSSNILRLTIYNLIRVKWNPVLGMLRSKMLAIFVTFVVSGLMHELMFFYLTYVWPTWEVTWFFVLHGACTAVEVAVKEMLKGSLQLHRVVSWPITMAFVLATLVWLFFPQLLRNDVDVKFINECLIVVNTLGLCRNEMC